MNDQGVSSPPQVGGHPHVVVVGGGLAGLSAAIGCLDAGARVTLLERRRRIGGLTWSFDHDDRSIDNGQHVFFRCCVAYLAFLRRIGSDHDVEIQPRLDITVLRPSSTGGPPTTARLRRLPLPAPFHLGPALLGYRLLPWADRLRLGRAAIPLRSLDLTDPSLDDETFASWLARHGQSPTAITGLWDLITVATVNLPSAEASATMGAKVLQTGLLSDAGAADIGWARVPLGRLHGERAAAVLARGGAEVHLGERVTRIDPRGPGAPRGPVDPLGLVDPRGPGAPFGPVGHRRAGPTGPTGPASRSPELAPAGGGFAVRTEHRTIDADAVIVALPHDVTAQVLPPGSFPQQERIADLGTSAIVDVHVRYDRKVTDLPLAAGVDTQAQWIFDRTVSSGLAASPDQGRGQYLAVSLSAADDELGRHPDQLATGVVAELARLYPLAAGARVLDTLVTKERTATFRAVPGTAAMRPGPGTVHPGLALAGAWTDTGWPATMEGAVRSGTSAARWALSAIPCPRALPEEVA